MIKILRLMFNLPATRVIEIPSPRLIEAIQRGEKEGHTYLRYPPLVLWKQIKLGRFQNVKR